MTRLDWLKTILGSVLGLAYLWFLAVGIAFVGELGALL